MTLLDLKLTESNTIPLNSLACHVGNTPLLPLRRVTLRLPPRVKVFVKAEWFNPGGSVKDRPALNIIQNAILNGDLGRGKRLLDSTSGNMGISYATFCAALGIPVTLAVPASASSERIAMLNALGAELILTDPLEGSDGAILKARELAAEFPDKFWYANQYDNESNWQAHYLSTGPEIARQTNGQITHFVAGLAHPARLSGRDVISTSACRKSRRLPFSRMRPFTDWKDLSTCPARSSLGSMTSLWLGLRSRSGPRRRMR